MGISSVKSNGLTARQQAAQEIREEMRGENVDKFKVKLAALKKAKKIVANLERDVDELEIELGDGD